MSRGNKAKTEQAYMHMLLYHGRKQHIILKVFQRTEGKE